MISFDPCVKATALGTDRNKKYRMLRVLFSRGDPVGPANVLTVTVSVVLRAIAAVIYRPFAIRIPPVRKFYYAIGPWQKKPWRPHKNQR